MEQRVSMVTLGVADHRAAKAFYERLGWRCTLDTQETVFFQVGGSVLTLWARDKLAESVVRGVPSRLERAIANLLDNAVKWSPPGGEIDVGVADHEVTVRDHGPGIDESDLPFVFDRFYRAAAARSMPGFGLGLALVQQVAEEHGATVTIERPEGGGTLVRFKLPDAVD